MGEIERVVCSNAQELSGTVAAEWLDRVAAAAQDQPYTVALSGGRIAKPFFAAIVEQARQRRMTLRNVEFFWADERCVPPDDSESNFSLAREALFAPMGIQQERIHRIRGEIDPATAAAHAEAELCRIARIGDGKPILDLAFLGMGEDGHTASLFPDAPPSVTESTAVYLPVVGPKPPPQRITLTFAVLAAADEAWVLISGSGKREALERSLHRRDTPLGRLFGMRQRTRIFTDFDT